MSKETKRLVIVAGVTWDVTADVLWDQAAGILLSRRDATLHLCHVIAHDHDPSTEASEMDKAMSRLYAWVTQKVGRRDAPICGQIHLEVAIGDPATELAQMAVDHHADLLLLGTHARTGVSRLVLGSVAERAMHLSPCAVLIARPRDFEGRATSPSVAPPSAAGQKGFRPHATRYRSSVVYASYDATRG